MAIWLVVLLFILGIILIIKGGDLFVDAAIWMAEVSGIPHFLIGATVVSIATTLPELIVSLIAAGQGKVDMAAGNAIGSVTANVAMILGISVVCLPAVIKRANMAVKMILMVAAIGLLLFFSRSGELSIRASVILLLLFGIYMYENIHSTKKCIACNKEEKRERPTKKVVWINIAKFVFGTVGIVWGADLLVDNGSLIANAIGVAANVDPLVMEGIVSVTIIAIGTSLPELVTTITAIRKNQSALSIGNIIGANVIDLTIILPLCAIVSGKALPVSKAMVTLDMPMCLLACVIVVIPTLITEKIRRGQGITLLLLYITYLVYMIHSFL
jgi:cation:H+ antiporter